MKTEFNGRIYSLHSTGYLYRGRQALHRVVWEYHNGAIPDGYHVHHVDEDKTNNDIGNLKIISAGDHVNIHRANNEKARLEAFRNSKKAKSAARTNIRKAIAASAELPRSDKQQASAAKGRAAAWVLPRTEQQIAASVANLTDAWNAPRTEKQKIQMEAARKLGVEKSHRERQETCVNCGESFTTRSNRAKYCGGRCKLTYWKRNSTIRKAI